VTTVSLPWPSPLLSPNARAHWRVRAKAAAGYRADSFYATRAALGRSRPIAPVVMTVEFRPPDNRRRDRDNMIASIKAALDGMADAFGIDDSEFKPTFTVGDPTPGGAVNVTITSTVSVEFRGVVR
jgi:crossover junction endodeoxyribonuclease RusA